MFHRCGVDCGRQDKCIQPSFNVRLNSCCRFFTGSLSRLQAASSAVLSGWFSSLKRTITTVCSASLFASELKTGPVCPQPLCVLVVTSVDKLLVQLVRLVHRFTCITADLLLLSSLTQTCAPVCSSICALWIWCCCSCCCWDHCCCTRRRCCWGGCPS